MEFIDVQSISIQKIQYNLYSEILSFFPIESLSLYFILVIWYPSDCSKINLGVFYVFYWLFILSNFGFVALRFREEIWKFGTREYLLLSLRGTATSLLFISFSFLRAKPLKCSNMWNPFFAVGLLIISFVFVWYLSSQMVLQRQKTIDDTKNRLSRPKKFKGRDSNKGFLNIPLV